MSQKSSMFKTAITASPLTGGLAEDCFGERIECANFRSDVSLAATARVLFDKRLADKEKIRITLTPLYYNDGFPAAQIKDAAMNLKCGDLKIFSVSTKTADLGKWIPAAKDALKDSGLYELEAIEKWFAATPTTALVYTDKPYDPKIPRSPVDNSKTIVIVENMILSRWHLIGALLPRFLGKWFNEKPRTADETTMLQGFMAESPDILNAAFEKYAQEYDFRGMAIRSKLKDFEVKFAKVRAKTLEEQCRNLDNEISDYSRRIGEGLRKKEDILAMLFGYQTQSAKDIEPLTMNYFLANKNLYLQEANQDYLEFYDTAWFTNWDPDKADATFGRGHCSNWLSHNKKFGISDEDAMLLYKALFLEETVKVKLWSHIKLFLRGDDPMCIYGGSSCLSDIHNALPNPHHQYNSCGGGNRSYVAQCIIDRDIVGALEQCISATAGINLTEHASYQYFCRDLFDPAFGEVVYINELGEFKTAKDAIEWLKEKQNGKKQEAEKEAKEATE